MMLVERFWKSLPKAGGCDVDIIIELDDNNTVKFPCHRQILSKSSDVFKMKLSKKPDSIAITDMDPHMMFQVLRYIYGEKLSPVHWTTTVDLLLAAASYKIASLYQHCVHLLLESLNLSNPCSLLEVATACSIPELYARSLHVCVNGAFHVLESEDFEAVLPSTVISIVSDPNLNVPNETYVLYALWTRATIDASRRDVELTYNNLEKYFEPYSKIVQFEDVDKNELERYDNKSLMKYFDERQAVVNEIIYPVKRGMKFPLGLLAKFFVCYSSVDMVTMRSLQGQARVEFDTKETFYLIELRMACCYKANVSHLGIERLVIIENGEVMLAWNIEENNNSKLSLTLKKRTVYTREGDIILQEFRFALEDLVKLRRSRTYAFEVKPFPAELLWPEYKDKVASSSPINMHCRKHPCLTSMTLLPSPTF